MRHRSHWLGWSVVLAGAVAFVSFIATPRSSEKPWPERTATQSMQIMTGATLYRASNESHLEDLCAWTLVFQAILTPEIFVTHNTEERLKTFSIGGYRADQFLYSLEPEEEIAALERAKKVGTWERVGDYLINWDATLAQRRQTNSEDEVAMVSIESPHRSGLRIVTMRSGTIVHVRDWETFAGERNALRAGRGFSPLPDPP